MDYPVKYKDLVQCLMKRRKKINGFFTDIILTREAIESIQLDPREVYKMLTEVVLNDSARIEHPKTKKLTVVKIIEGEVKMGHGEIKITQCDTIVLEAYLLRIEGELKESKIIPDGSKMAIKMPEMDKWLQFNKGNTFLAFSVLHKSFPQVVSYHDIYKRIMGFTEAEFEPEEVKYPESRVKTIQNIINHLQKRMDDFGFRKGTVKSVDGVGYQLTI